MNALSYETSFFFKFGKRAKWGRKVNNADLTTTHT